MQQRIWPRLGAVSGVLYVVLLMGSTSTGSDAQIVIALELIAILLFLPFLGYLTASCAGPRERAPGSRRPPSAPVSSTSRSNSLASLRALLLARKDLIPSFIRPWRR
jgi:hypothetical protein